MVLRLLSLSSAIIIILCCVPALCTEQNEAPSDTASTPRLYDPPRVITPDDQGASQPESRQSAQAKDGGVQPSGRCWTCRESGRARVGGGGGPVPGWLFANLDEINSKIKDMGIPDLSETILLMGGKGYARIGKLVIGGAGYGGSTRSSGIPDCCARDAEITIAYGGLVLGLSMNNPIYEATAGMLFGGGVIEVERTRNSQYAFGWNSAWEIFETDAPGVVTTDELNVASTLEADFIALEPFIEVRYWILSWMALDLSVSYLRARIEKGEWIQDGVRIPDSPQTDIGGPSIKLGIHFGV